MKYIYLAIPTGYTNYRDNFQKSDTIVDYI